MLRVFEPGTKYLGGEIAGIREGDEPGEFVGRDVKYTQSVEVVEVSGQRLELVTGCQKCLKGA